MTKTFDIIIQSQAYGGFGVARHEGRVLFVPDTLKGDKVRVQITDEKKNFAFASVVECLEESALRIPSDCPYEKHCGGCQWLPLPYEVQVDFKKECLRDALQRIGKLSLNKDIIVHKSSSRYYRNRVLFRGTIHKDGSIHVGFMERASHTQVAIEHCLNVDAPINDFIKRISKLHISNASQKFRMEVQVLPETNKLLVVLHSLHGPQSLKSLKEILLKDAEMEWVGFAQELSKSPFFLFENDLGLSFHTVPGAFQQVNLALNHVARRLIQTWVDQRAITSILDLYCGSGNLSLSLANTSRKILGVEQSAKAIDIAKHNVKVNALTSIEYYAQASDLYLKTLKENIYDLFIVDPPRKGMKECLDAMKRLKPKYLIYMSCDPTTLARDLKELSEFYTVDDIHLFDFFPNTEHLETLVFLNLSS